MTTILSNAIDRAKSAGIIHYIDANFRQRARRAYRRCLADPGDCAGDDSLLIGLAIGEAVIGRRPGWIPEVQRIGCEIARLLEGGQP
jgi:hypothetical protein